MLNENNQENPNELESLDQEVSNSQESSETAPVVEAAEVKVEEISISAEVVEEKPVAEEAKVVVEEEAILEEDDSDSDHDDEVTYKMEHDHEHEDETDLSGLSAEQLVELIEQAARQDDLVHAVKTAKSIKNRISSIFEDEEQAALEAFLEEGNEKDDFQPKPNELKSRFRDAFRKIQLRRAEERERIEEEKKKNLHIKRRILDDLKLITEGDETPDALDKVKELQVEWKKIRAVPRENVQELWDSYRYYLDKFYDNLSINQELKDLDRKKNLETKIELCKKVDELQDEKSVKNALNMLNRYHDEWKHTGPVPKEYAEELWARFKAASDKIYELKKAQIEEMNVVRRKNLELKEALNEKLEQLAGIIYDKPKEWIEKTKEIEDLFDDWKKIGQVPKEFNDKVWARFKDLRNHFFRQKNIFFKQLNKVKADNLALKEALVAKAEALKNSDDWQKTTQELIRLQNEWKKIGTVPEKMNEEIWKRFRTHCDEFFARKEAAFKGQKEEQENNLKLKQVILDEVKQMMNEEEAKADAVFQRLRELQKNWNSIGFVPIKAKEKLQKEYSSTVDALYKKHKRNVEEMKEGQLMEHYESLAGSPDAKKRLQDEERKIREKMRFLKSEVETLENNIGFFSNSKTAGPLIKGIKDKIAKANEQMQRLQKELNAIKKLY